MQISSFLKKNKFFSVFTIIFSIWLIFLIVISIINNREVIFYDALAQNDVSSQYKSTIPILRYFIEPFSGIASLFDTDFYWLIALVIIYIGYRITYLTFKKFGMFKSLKYKAILYPIDNFMRFTFKLFSLVLIIIGITILIGYIILGFYFVSRYFMVIVQLGVRISFIILILKVAYNLIVLLHPRLKFHYFRKEEEILLKNKKKWSIYTSSIKREFIYLLGTLYLILTSFILLVSTPFPTYKIETNLSSDDFLFDFHVHTTMSDGWLTPEQRVMWYISHGISGAVFTDHDTLRGGKAAEKFVKKYDLDFIVFNGQEWTDNENVIHMNIYGIKEEIVPPMSDNPFTKVMNASQMIYYVKNEGGYVIVNHYNAKPNKNGGIGVPYNFTQLMDWGVDGFEIVNGDSIQESEIRDFCLSNGLICLGGSDIHTNEDLNCFVKLKLLDPTNMSIENIFNNLARNEHEVVAIKLHSNIIDIPEELNDLGFEIFEDFLNYLFNLNALQVVSWIVWSGLVYSLLFLTYRKVKKANFKSLRKKFS